MLQIIQILLNNDESKRSKIIKSRWLNNHTINTVSGWMSLFSLFPPLPWHLSCIVHTQPISFWSFCRKSSSVSLCIWIIRCQYILLKSLTFPMKDTPL